MLAILEVRCLGSQVETLQVADQVAVKLSRSLEGGHASCPALAALYEGAASVAGDPVPNAVDQDSNQHYC